MEVKDFIPTIKEDYVSVFASGNSVLTYTKEELDLIKEKTYMIGINYCVTYLRPHMLFWSDKNVTDFLIPHYSQNPIQETLVSREPAFNSSNPAHNEFKNRVHYWFDKNTNQLPGNYTIVWILSLLTRFLPPNKKIMVFGLDMKIDENDKEKKLKWYDRFTQHDRRVRGSYNAKLKLSECAQQLDQFIINHGNIVNCNLDSGYLKFKKEDWKTILVSKP